MCGIAGWFGTGEGPKSDQVAKTLGKIARRGPDHSASFISDGLALCHTRLSILDTSEAAHQPFTIPGSVNTLVFNGEIFNFKSLRTELEKEGLRFTTRSDTEVLFQLLQKEGSGCLEKLNGFFSFAFYNGEKDELLVARDRLGIKPFYYTFNENDFYFGSELSVINSLGVVPEIDIASLGLYMQLTYLPPPYTILKQVFKLEPGCYIQIKKNQKPEPVRYYELAKKNVKRADPEPEKKLASLLSDSIKMRLVADVPVGTFLSGGIDSAIITSLAHQHHPSIEAFTIAFPDEPFFDESRTAALLAKKHNIQHHILPATGADVEQAIEDTLSYLDEPFADSSAIAVNLLSKKVSTSIRVALSGDGADELFGGYNKHRAMLRASFPGISENFIRQTGRIWRNLPSSRSSYWQNKIRQAGKFSLLTSLPPSARYWELATFLDAKRINSLMFQRDQTEEDERKNYLLKNFNPEQPLESSLLTDLTMVLPGDMLTKVDRMSMCHSLEVRVPFLDHRLVEFALGIPIERKLNRSKGKIILRETFGNLLPDEILNGGKKGFEVPLGKWLRLYCADQISELFREDRIKEQGLFHSSAINRLKEKFLAGDDSLTTAVWQILVYQRWFNRQSI